MSTSSSAPAIPARKPAVTLFVAAFAAFLATFNETFLNVGFAPIMENLFVDVSTVQWLATAYMLGAAVMVPVSAFAYRSFPTRPLFCATAALLVAGSVIGALAQNFIILLAGRIVQALGTGMLIPIGMNITLEAALREKLGTYMGIMGAMTTLGPSSSVILAGLILAVAPWQALLWVFAGLSALCLLAGAVILRDVAHLTHPRLDASSVALIGIALIGILYGVSTAFAGSLLVAGVAVIIGIISLVLFVRRQGTLEEPLINLEPLRVRPFALGVAVNMLSLLTIFAMNIIVSIFMQSVLGTPSLVASLTLFPAILCSCAVSPVAGRVYDKRGPGVLLPLGFACIAVFSVLTGIYAAVTTAGVAAGAGYATAATQAMEVTGTLVGAVGVVGFACALVIRRMAARPASDRKGSWEHVEVETAADTSGMDKMSSCAALMKTDVYTLPMTATVAEAMELFAEKGISGAPVVGGEGALCGFVSDGDVMRSLADQVPALKSAWSFLVELGNVDFEKTMAEVMSMPVERIATRNVTTVAVDDDMGAVARILADNHLKKAPVMDGDRMVGIINRSNITNYAVAAFLEAGQSQPVS